MINPQMGMNAGMPDVPTTKELWKNEKSKYRHWILLFGIGISSVFALLLTSFILNMLSTDDIKNALKDPHNGYFSIPTNITDKSKWLSDAADKSFMTTFVIMPSLQLLSIGLGILYFGSTIYTSYKKQSFARISQWATMVIGIGTLIAIFQLFQMFWSKSTRIVFNSDFPGGIFQFINYFLIIAVYFGASIKVNRIRREFAISERIEQLKNDPQYQAQMKAYQDMMANQGQGMRMGPMGPVWPAGQTQQPSQTQTTSSNVPPVNGVNQPIVNPVDNISKEEKDLNAMSLIQLKAVAKELSISGVSTMKKQEIIKSILRVTGKGK